eukprot:6177928-Pleurochrysis_carterae.AAC.1
MGGTGREGTGGDGSAASELSPQTTRLSCHRVPCAQRLQARGSARARARDRRSLRTRARSLGRKRYTDACTHGCLHGWTGSRARVAVSSPSVGMNPSRSNESASATTSFIR